MSQERRRYFRINDTVKLTYKLLTRDGSKQNAAGNNQQPYLKKEDQQILELIKKLSLKQPEVAAIMALFNQKLERLGHLLTLDGQRLDSIAMQLKKVNISACGMAFHHSTPIKPLSILELEVMLLPDEHVICTQGRIVACHRIEDDKSSEDIYYVRVDFYGMSAASQERLIQHIVKNQIVS